MEQSPPNSLSESLEFHKRWVSSRYQVNLHDLSDGDNEILTNRTLRSNRKDTPESQLMRTQRTAISRSRFLDEESYGSNKLLNFTSRNNETYPRTTEEADDDHNIPTYSPENPQKRWETLYQLNKKNLEIKKQLMKAAMNKDLDPECTFQPKLNQYTYRTPRSIESIHDRNIAWLEQREAKLEIGREMNEAKSMLECSFRPSLSPYRKNSKRGIVTPFQYHGIENHILRQLTARKNKEEFEYLRENPMSKFPESVFKKEGKFTVGVEPYLQTSARAMKHAELKELEDMQEELLTPKRKALVELNKRGLQKTHHGYRDEEAQKSYREKRKTPTFEPNGKFTQALVALHKELHRFDVNYE